MKNDKSARRVITGVVSAIALLVLSLVALSACSDDEPSEEEATSAYCGDLNDLESALGAYADLSVNSTIDEVNEAQEGVEDAYADVQASAEDVADARIDDLESAYEDLANSAAEISGEDTVGEAYTTLATNAQAVDAARENLSSSANCGVE
jgi:hypothetical protein